MRTLEQSVDRRVQVGERVARLYNQQLLEGLYAHKEFAYASQMGVVRQRQPNCFFIENRFPVKCLDIRVGDTVYGTITRIREEEAFLTLVQVNEVSLQQQIEGTIRREHVREKMVDQVVMADSFRPTDVVKARVISLGDSARNLYLSTAGEDLGVLVAKNEGSGKLMLPYDWSSMIDVSTGESEKRKVAKPQM